MTSPDDRLEPHRARWALGALAVVASTGVAAGGALPGSIVAGPAAPGGEGSAGSACRPGPGAGGAVDPTRVEMSATRRARGGSGLMTLRFSSSPFGVALSDDGSYRYLLRVAVEDLPPLPEGTYVAWAATPELDRHEKLGSLGASGEVAGEVAWNKFLVFVTAETSPEVETWSQSIVLSARSPSGRMHTMAGHGPFSGEPCLDPRP